MARISSHIDFSGPFFKSNPSLTFRDNVDRMMTAIVQEGKADVVQQLAAGESSRAPMSRGLGRLSQHIMWSMTGWEWLSISRARYGVVKPYAAGADDAIALYAAGAGRHQGSHGVTKGVEPRVHAFKHTATALRKARAINAAELLKGIE